MAFILLSEDCNTFIPCPLCPTTKNFGILNDALLLFISTPAQTQNVHNLKLWQSEGGYFNWKEKQSPALIPVEKREEKRVREAFSVTWSRDGTSETWTALRAIGFFFFFFLLKSKREREGVSGYFENCREGGALVGYILWIFQVKEANRTGSMVRIFDLHMLYAVGYSHLTYTLFLVTFSVFPND